MAYTIPVLEVRKRRVTVEDIARNRARRSFAMPEAIVQLAMPLLAAEVAEVIGVLALTTRNTLLGWVEVARGGVDSAAVTPSDIVRPLLLAGAATFVVVHNHPSGDPSPSAEDRELTKRLRHASDLLAARGFSSKEDRHASTPRTTLRHGHGTPHRPSTDAGIVDRDE